MLKQKTKREEKLVLTLMVLLNIVKEIRLDFFGNCRYSAYSICSDGDVSQYVHIKALFTLRLTYRIMNVLKRAFKTFELLLDFIGKKDYFS